MMRAPESKDVSCEAARGPVWRPCCLINERAAWRPAALAARKVELADIHMALADQPLVLATRAWVLTSGGSGINSCGHLPTGCRAVRREWLLYPVAVELLQLSSNLGRKLYWFSVKWNFCS